MAAGPLHITITDGPNLTTALIDELWRLRVSLLTLTKDPDADRAFFGGFISRDDSLVASFADRDGAVQGFFSITFLPVEPEGRRGLLMYSKYFYFAKAYRGHPKTLVAPWMILPRAFRRYGLRALYFVTTSFPQSYVSLSRSSGTVRSLKDPEATTWERAALNEFATTLFADDWDPVALVVRNQNIVDPPALHPSAEAIRLTEKFEEQNPTWRDGHSMPIIFPVSPTTMATSIRRTARRALRR